MRIKSKLLLSAIGFSLLAAGCGGGGEEPAQEAQTPSGDKPAVMAAAGSSTINGTVNFTGTAPAAKRVNQDQECRVLHTEPVYSQNVIVNENGTLRNVFVYVKEGLGDRKFDPPSEPVVFDQKGCVYEPHVFGVQKGQTIKILNSDPLLHNIHALPKDNRPFNFGMPKQGDVRERSFKKTEVMVKIKCDVHPWMGAYCGVLDHPFFSVSGDDGSYSIKNLPAGEYVIEAWHEKYGTLTQTITVGDDETTTADFSIGKTSS